MLWPPQFDQKFKFDYRIFTNSPQVILFLTHLRQMMKCRLLKTKQTSHLHCTLNWILQVFFTSSARLSKCSLSRKEVAAAAAAGVVKEKNALNCFLLCCVCLALAKTDPSFLPSNNQKQSKTEVGTETEESTIHSTSVARIWKSESRRKTVLEKGRHEELQLAWSKLGPGGWESGCRGGGRTHSSNFDNIESAIGATLQGGWVSLFWWESMKVGTSWWIKVRVDMESKIIKHLWNS